LRISAGMRESLEKTLGLAGEAFGHPIVVGHIHSLLLRHFVLLLDLATKQLFTPEYTASWLKRGPKISRAAARNLFCRAVYRETRVEFKLFLQTNRGYRSLHLSMPRADATGVGLPVTRDKVHTPCEGGFSFIPSSAVSSLIFILQAHLTFWQMKSSTWYLILPYPLPVTQVYLTG